ncbi:MAG: hypothetical protein ABIP48_14300, partial [Planctomycetota bacterium]
RELGVYYFGARWLNPSLGHFVGADPVVLFEMSGAHSYVYTDGLLFTFVDPSGADIRSVSEYRRSNPAAAARADRVSRRAAIFLYKATGGPATVSIVKETIRDVVNLPENLWRGGVAAGNAKVCLDKRDFKGAFRYYVEYRTYSEKAGNAIAAFLPLGRGVKAAKMGLLRGLRNLRRLVKPSGPKVAALVKRVGAGLGRLGTAVQRFLSHPRWQRGFLDPRASAARSVSNPYGKKGGPAHQGKAADVVADVESRGLRAGTEHKVTTPGGEKGSRYVDVVGKDAQGNVVEMHQVGRQTKGGQPVSRERKALDDIEGATGTRPTFHPYN